MNFEEKRTSAVRGAWRYAVVVLIAMVAMSVAAAPGADVDAWQAKLDKTAKLLNDAKYVEARDVLIKQTRDMADAIGAPGEADRLLAAALAQLAIAEAGAGDAEGAVWHWQIAQNINPDIRTMDLSAYGKVADVLAENILPPTPGKCSTPVTVSGTVVKRMEPKYPKRAQKDVRGIVIVEIALDATGRPITPQVLSSPSAALTYSTLMTLRDWRFAPPQAGDPARFCRLFSYGQHR